MPLREPDPTDPMTLHGVGVETDSEEATVEMAVCFIEEFARMGFDADRLFRIFRTPGYAGPAMALSVLGADRIRALIAESLELRGNRVSKQGESTVTPRGVSLPVLETGC